MTHKTLDDFLQNVRCPLVIVSTLLQKDREAVTQFLKVLNAPVYLEGVSGLRENRQLQHLCIRHLHHVWNEKASDHVDGILRIGGVPTCRLWRDLEDYKHIPVFSVSHLPFSGLSGGSLIDGPLAEILSKCGGYSFTVPQSDEWYVLDNLCSEATVKLYQEMPCAEPSLFHFLSQKIPVSSTVYLGNSMPIRQWDLAAAHVFRKLDIFASRGLNGIDGQISTFLGLSQPDVQNWGIFGDLTALYDMAAFWILDQIPDVAVNSVIVNNGGGKIFSRMFSQKEFQNCHTLSFESLGSFWNLNYERWEKIPENDNVKKRRLIELVPDHEETEHFWDEYAQLPKKFERVETAVINSG